MTSTEIQALINTLPNIIIYFVPGYIFISVKNFILSKSEDKSNNILLKSIVISYIILNIEEIIYKIFADNDSFEVIKGSSLWIVVTFVVSIFFAWLYTKIILCEYAKRILSIGGINRLIHDEFLYNIFDNELGNWIRVYLPTEEIIVQGMLKTYHETDEGYYLVLSKYSSYKYNGVEIEKNESDNTKLFLCHSKDISRLEIKYGEKSKKILQE